MLNPMTVNNIITGLPTGENNEFFKSRTKDLYVYKLAVCNTSEYTEWLLNTGQITEEVKENLMNMINSEDHDNFYLALLAIDQIIKK